MKLALHSNDGGQRATWRWMTRRTHPSRSSSTHCGVTVNWSTPGPGPSTLTRSVYPLPHPEARLQAEALLGQDHPHLPGQCILYHFLWRDCKLKHSWARTIHTYQVSVSSTTFCGETASWSTPGPGPSTPTRSVYPLPLSVARLQAEALLGQDHPHLPSQCILYHTLRRDCKLKHSWARTIHTYQFSVSSTIRWGETASWSTPGPGPSTPTRSVYPLHFPVARLQAEALLGQDHPHLPGQCILYHTLRRDCKLKHSWARTIPTYQVSVSSTTRWGETASWSTPGPGPSTPTRSVYPLPHAEARLQAEALLGQDHLHPPGQCILYHTLRRDCKLKHSWARTIHTYQVSVSSTTRWGETASWSTPGPGPSTPTRSVYPLPHAEARLQAEALLGQDHPHLPGQCILYHFLWRDCELKHSWARTIHTYQVSVSSATRWCETASWSTPGPGPSTPTRSVYPLPHAEARLQAEALLGQDHPHLPGQCILYHFLWRDCELKHSWARTIHTYQVSVSSATRWCETASWSTPGPGPSTPTRSVYPLPLSVARLRAEALLGQDHPHLPGQCILCHTLMRDCKLKHSWARTIHTYQVSVSSTTRWCETASLSAPGPGPSTPTRSVRAKSLAVVGFVTETVSEEDSVNLYWVLQYLNACIYICAFLVLFSWPDIRMWVALDRLHRPIGRYEKLLSYFGVRS